MARRVIIRVGSVPVRAVARISAPAAAGRAGAASPPSRVAPRRARCREGDAEVEREPVDAPEALPGALDKDALDAPVRLERTLQAGEALRVALRL